MTETGNLAGARYRIDGAGDAACTVVFENGMGTTHELWASIADRVGTTLRTFRYDRVPVRRYVTARQRPTPHRRAQQLSDLLAELDVPGPYLVVGHSYGGILVRHFAVIRPADTVGMVLVDASHPEALERSIRQRRGLPWVEQRVKVRQALSRLRRRLPRPPYGELLTDEQIAEIARVEADPVFWDSARCEIDEWKLLDGEMYRPPNPLGHFGFPVSVLSAEETTASDPMQAELHRELTALSPRSEHVHCRRAGHISMLLTPEHVDVIATAILGVAASSSEKPAQEVMR